jgi:hypothetical protein
MIDLPVTAYEIESAIAFSGEIFGQRSIRIIIRKAGRHIEAVGPDLRLYSRSFRIVDGRPLGIPRGCARLG